MKISSLKSGSVLSESSFFVVKSVDAKGIVASDEFGNDINLSKEYVEKILNSADQFSTEEKYTKTQLADLFINSPRIAMTVAFTKQDTAKTKKAYEAEVAAAVEAVQNAKVSEVEGLLKNLIANPISKNIPGELRVMKGRHDGFIDDLGRIAHFIDMEKPLSITATGHDTRSRQVDPRTISYIIVNDVKYTLK